MRPLGPAFEREARRIHLRFNQEIVEGLGICPYARIARETGGGVILLRPEPIPTTEILHGIVDELAGQPRIEVAQVVFPRATLSAAEFLEFSARFGEENGARTPRQRPTFVHAAFHPRLAYGTETPPRLVPFFRRSPDPMVQLVRLSVLDAIHAGKPRGTQFFDGDLASLLELLRQKRTESVTDRITRENHERAMAGDLERIQAIHEDIAQDRERSYALAEQEDQALA
ncbi:MAG: hypothetical protein RMJ98_18420, partial [Myxococcales bacterium]|nr:hypothetical protein [Polyangiaceae bacterium]MDW8251274.1 hypothetical protein [Myxococcales bacterium]